MAEGTRIGRIAGVEVRLHWTWWLAAALIAISLATTVFPDVVGGLSDTAYLAMGLVTALLFFASLLLHELGHALEARREGIATRAITLWMLGGVAWSAERFPSPGVEARVALAGPAVSAVLGGALVGAGLINGLPDSVATVLLWLGWTNLLLLAFNLIPALPLDGGRVVRALLWRMRGNLLAATRGAARVSQAIAVALFAVGLVGFLIGSGLGGLWLAFIGWFVFSAAARERQVAEAEFALGGLHVADVMTPDPVTIGATASVADLLELRNRVGHSVYPVVVDEDGTAIGLVSILDAERLPERRRDWATVRELLRGMPALVVVNADADVLSAMPALVGNPLRRAAVVRAGRLVGLLSMSDVAHAVRLRVRGARP
jgi:Zn-dependent protease/CBS domain-containing protein